MISQEDKKRLGIESFQRNIHRYFNFYRSFFDSESLALEFICLCEADIYLKRMMHQLVRIISMADNAYKLDESTCLDGVKLQYLIMAIESLFEAQNQTNKKTKSHIVSTFFTQYIRSKDQEVLSNGIVSMELETTTISEIAHIFNGVRNTVAHEGINWLCRFAEEENYYGYIFKPKKDEKDSLYYLGDDRDLTKVDKFWVKLNYTAVRDIIVRGLIDFINKNLETRK
ncbi:hypothetical protein [Paenibacillus polymyxa]|uniref:hypothetical protein n=1 Tax=Paenibacillus polymyxa TaxID=1406 RepID=UPI002ED2D245|nr:hypothetical protein [Paenibacillus polymyxa]